MKLLLWYFVHSSWYDTYVDAFGGSLKRKLRAAKNKNKFKAIYLKKGKIVYKAKRKHYLGY